MTRLRLSGARCNSWTLTRCARNKDLNIRGLEREGGYIFTQQRVRHKPIPRGALFGKIEALGIQVLSGGNNSRKAMAPQIIIESVEIRLVVGDGHFHQRDHLVVRHDRGLRDHVEGQQVTLVNKKHWTGSTVGLDRLAQGREIPGGLHRIVLDGWSDARN
jgi:hypothetical protein